MSTKMKVITIKKNGVVSKYSLRYKVGEGGTGSVFLCETVENNVIKVSAAKVSHFKNLIHLESSIMKALSDKNVPGIPMYFETIDLDGEKTYILLMQYIHGTDFYDLTTMASLHMSRIKQWFLDLCDILLQVHKNGVIHRDVKLENIIIDTDDKLYLIDWGLASFLSNINDVCCGTLGYVAPEAMDQIYGPCNDVWSMCVTLYAAISGREPFVNTRKFKYSPVYGFFNSSGEKDAYYSFIPSKHRTYLSKLFDDVFVPHDKRPSLEDIKVRLEGLVC